MIHVICLNPAIDKLFEIDDFTAGEDYPGQMPQARVGGKGVNVARVLTQLGEKPRLYAFLGERGGDAVREEMESRCACKFFTVPGLCRTTVNIIDRKNNRETVITEVGPKVSASDVAAMLYELEKSVAAGDIVCCSGSIIAGAPEDIYARIAALCGRKGACCTLDCNAKALTTSLRGANYALGKPNERELTALLGEERTKEPKRIVELARRIMPPYEAMLVSMGAQGGIYVTKDAAYYAPTPEVEVVSTVGCGDATLAGAITAMARGMEPEELLQLAMACGAANAALGQVGSVKPGRVDMLKKSIAVTQV